MIFKKTFLVLALLSVQTSYSYIVSAFKWTLEFDQQNKKKIIVLGDHHKENQIDREHTAILKDYFEWCDRAHHPLYKIRVFIESPDFFTSRMLKCLLHCPLIGLKNEEGVVIDEMRIFAVNYLGFGALNFQLLDYRGPVIYDFLGLFSNIAESECALDVLIPDIQTLPTKRTTADIDAHLNKHPEFWNDIEKYRKELKKLSMQRWFKRLTWKRFATTEDLFAEITKSIAILKKEAAIHSDIKILQNLIQSIEATFEVFKERFKEISPKTALIDWIINQIHSKKSFLFLDELYIAFYPLHVAIADAGFIVELLKQMPHYHMIVLYVGAYHAKVINSFLEEYAEKFSGSKYVESHPWIYQTDEGNNFVSKPLDPEILKKIL